MWSHGPIVEDHPTQHVRYATSDDGLHWSDAKEMMPPDPDPEFRYISRGFWIRDRKLLALASRDEAKTNGRIHFFGKSLALRAYEWGHGERHLEGCRCGLRRRYQQLPSKETSVRSMDDVPPRSQNEQIDAHRWRAFDLRLESRSDRPTERRSLSGGAVLVDSTGRHAGRYFPRQFAVKTASTEPSVKITVARGPSRFGPISPTRRVNSTPCGPAGATMSS